MSSSSTHRPTAAWPTGSSELASLLAIERYHTKKCSGRATKAPTCGNAISQDSTDAIDQKLLFIVQAGRVTESVLKHIKDLASLVLCRRFHQKQAAEKEAAFTEILHSISHTQDSQRSAGRRPTASTAQDAAQHTATTRRTRQHPHSTDAPVEDTIIDPQTPAPVRRTRSHPLSPPPSSETDTRNHIFLPMGTHRSTLSINGSIKRKLLTPYTSDVGDEGYIYANALPDSHTVTNSLSAPSHPAANYLKIGYSKDPSRRRAEWAAQCGYTPQSRFTIATPRPRTVERLVQLQLHNSRRSEPTCPVCSVRHCEWFEVEQDIAAAAVRLWSNWLRKEPYVPVAGRAAGGGLKPYWAARLERLELGREGAWEWFVGGSEDAAVVRNLGAVSRQVTPVRAASIVGDEDEEPRAMPATPPRASLPTPPPSPEQTSEVAGAILRLSAADKRLLFEAVLALVERQSSNVGPPSVLSTSPARPLVTVSA